MHINKKKMKTFVYHIKPTNLAPKLSAILANKILWTFARTENETELLGRLTAGVSGVDNIICSK